MSIIRKTLIITGCLMLTCCGKKGEKGIIPIGELKSQLEVKFYLYKQLAMDHQGPHGFVESEECDSTLFSGLTGTVLPVELEAAQEAGKWARRPLVNGQDTCYPDHSKSSISRDMFIGVMWYIWTNKRLDLAEQIWNYGSKNSWVMGEGDFSRIYFTPTIRATLAELIYRLGGPDYFISRNVPQIWSKSNIGFTAHLDVLHILLRASMTGGVTKKENEVLKTQYNRNPKNALFSYGFHKYNTGDQTETAVNLLNTSYFPKDRLPTNSDRKEPWLWQRDLGSDWEPAIIQEYKVHSGGDFLFVTKLLLEDLQ